MSITGLLISLLLIGIVTLLVIYPLARSKTAPNAKSSVQIQHDRIQTYYERVLTNIRDLDEDYTTGKINEEDYQAEREVWVHRGIRLLRVQDQLDSNHSLIDQQPVDATQVDDAIEAAIQAYREGDAPTFHQLSQAENAGV